MAHVYLLLVTCVVTLLIGEGGASSPGRVGRQLWSEAAGSWAEEQRKWDFERGTAAQSCE